jgi:hypothetical protein
VSADGRRRTISLRVNLKLDGFKNHLIFAALSDTVFSLRQRGKPVGVRDIPLVLPPTPSHPFGHGASPLALLGRITRIARRCG